MIAGGIHGKLDVTCGTLQIKPAEFGFIVTQDGNEIKNVTKVTLEIGLESVVTAKIEVIA